MSRRVKRDSSELTHDFTFLALGGYAGKGGWGALGGEVDPKEIMEEIQQERQVEDLHLEDEVRPPSRCFVSPFLVLFYPISPFYSAFLSVLFISQLIFTQIQRPDDREDLHSEN